MREKMTEYLKKEPFYPRGNITLKGVIKNKRGDVYHSSDQPTSVFLGA